MSTASVRQKPALYSADTPGRYLSNKCNRSRNQKHSILELIDNYEICDGEDTQTSKVIPLPQSEDGNNLICGN